MTLEVTSSKTEEHLVEIPCGSRRLAGILRIPAGAKGAVVFTAIAGAMLGQFGLLVGGLG